MTSGKKSRSPSLSRGTSERPGQVKKLPVHWTVAQLVERRPYKAHVAGSIPVRPTRSVLVAWVHLQQDVQRIVGAGESIAHEEAG